MSYSTSKAALIAEQLERLATQHMHQLAGQFPNLEFWMAEAEQALFVVSDYPQRFKKLRDAQVSWVQTHDTRLSVYCEICGGACEFGPRTPEAPRRIPSDELTAAGDGVRRGASRYLLRLYRAKLITESDLLQHRNRLDLPIEPEDYEHRDDDSE
jgi:hypothetical protein